MGKETIFRAPHVLFPHGVSRSGDRMKVAFCSFECSFEHSPRGLHAPRSAEDELRLLACILASPLALYYFFHTAANWGVERAKIHVAEYERFPFPKPDTPDRRQVLKNVAELHRSIEAQVEESRPLERVVSAHEEQMLDSLIYEYYEVDEFEKSLIDDTISIWIPSATPRRNSESIPSLEISLPAHRDLYVQTLLRAMTTWMDAQSTGIVAARIISPGVEFGIVHLALNPGMGVQNQMEKSSSDVLERMLRRLRRSLPKDSMSIRQLRDLKVFDGQDLYMFKPLARRHWTQTAAMNDADEILAAILLDREART